MARHRSYGQVDRQVNSKYANRKPTCDMIFGAISQYLSNCEIFTVKMCITWPLEWAKVKSKYVNWKATSYELAIAMFVLSVIVCEIFTIEMCMTLTFRMSQCQSKIYWPIESEYRTFSLMVKVIFALSAKLFKFHIHSHFTHVVL